MKIGKLPVFQSLSWGVVVFVQFVEFSREAA